MKRTSICSTKSRAANSSTTRPAASSPISPARFSRTDAADMFEYVKLHTELVLRAESIDLTQERGRPCQTDRRRRRQVRPHACVGKEDRAHRAGGHRAPSQIQPQGAFRTPRARACGARHTGLAGLIQPPRVIPAKPCVRTARSRDPLGRHCDGSRIALRASGMTKGEETIRAARSSTKSLPAGGSTGLPATNEFSSGGRDGTLAKIHHGDATACITGN